jgi:hypothetical protein
MAFTQRKTRAKPRRMTPGSLARLIGIPAARLPKACVAYLAEHNFNYRPVAGQERDALLVQVLERIETDRQQVGADERQAVWEAGWQEIYDGFVQSGCKLEALRPKYIRPGQPLRYAGQYIIPEDPFLEYHVFWVLRRWLFESFLTGFNQVHEFGCGTGHNLAELAQLFPQHQLWGTDFVKPPIQILEQLRRAHGMKIQGRLFNMKEPDAQYPLQPGSAIYTFGALEQLAGHFQALLEFWLEKRPGLCLHLEPIFELYEPSDLLDNLAVRFHRKRGYTAGFLTALKALEARGRVELLEVRRIRFGSTLMEGYSLVAWRPRA